MMNKFESIPTVYEKINFRSRLEAKWAFMFNRFGWTWEYEPIDLSGYIPDFIIHGLGYGNEERNILVEVKPILSKSEFIQYYSKIEKSGWSGEVLLLGAKLFDATDMGEINIGKLAERGTQGSEDDWWWEDAFLFKCFKCGAWSFAHSLGGWGSRICGHYDGDGYLDVWVSKDTQDYWKNAINYFQYKSN